MPIEHVLAVVPVADLEAANGWYERLLGRPADNRPMDSLVEWQVTVTGWVQVFVDACRAGTAMLNFAVDDLDKHVAELSSRGLAPGRSKWSTKAYSSRPSPIPTATRSPSSGTSASSTKHAQRETTQARTTPARDNTSARQHQRGTTVAGAHRCCCPIAAMARRR